MIALISFKEDLILTREEANDLKLKYEECDKVGIRDKRLQSMYSSEFYKDELEEKEENGCTKYFDNKGKEISSYYLYTRPKDLDYVKVKKENNLVDLEWFALNCKYPFYIEECIKSEEPTVQNIQSLLNKIEEKAQQIDKTIDIMKQQTFNQKCNVHVGGGMIATYNDLKLKENSCTDELQCELNNGWRIIAVCVQPDQRRPDYVLGRYNPELDTYNKNSAER